MRQASRRIRLTAVAVLLGAGTLQGLGVSSAAAGQQAPALPAVPTTAGPPPVPVPQLPATPLGARPLPVPPALTVPSVPAVPASRPLLPPISHLQHRPASVPPPLLTKFGTPGVPRPGPGQAWGHGMPGPSGVAAAASLPSDGYDPVPHCNADDGSSCSGPLTRGSGVVQHHPRVYVIFWGPEWNTNALDYQAVEVAQENLVNQLAGTPYQRLLGQYADPTDFPHDDTALGGVWVDPATPPTITGDDSTFATEAARASQINGWPNTADTDFIIYPQNGTSYVETLCGKHTDYHDPKTQNDFLAAYVRYAATCTKTPTNAGNMTMVASHEFDEMVTDPDTIHGWRAGSSGQNGEIGDLCNRQPGLFVAGLYAQTEFDNKSGQCRMDADGQTSPPQSVRSTTMQVSPTSDGFITEANRDHINMLNLEITTTNSAGNGLLVVYPAGQPAPRTTDINFTAGKTITQLVSIPLGVGGEVDFSATAGTEVIVDFLGVSYDGFYAGVATSHASDQARVADSRTPTAYCACRPIAPHSIGYAGFYNDINGNPTGVLAGTDGVSVHITALGPAGLGYLTAWPSVANVGAAIPPTNPGPPPVTTSVSFSAGISSGNDVIVAPAKDVNGQQYGYFAIYNGSSVTLNYLVDLHGYSTGSAPGRQTSISPVTRIEDTRSCGPLGGNLCGQLAPGAPTSFQVEGRGPTARSGMANVLLHVSTLNSAGRGYVQVWNGDTGPPNTSLNQTVPGAVVNDSIYVKVAANGRVYILSTVATDVIIEIHEWGGS